MREEVRQSEWDAKKRDVLQLLKDYRAYWTPYGAQMAAEDSHLRSAEFGPAGLTKAGAYFDGRDAHYLAQSYESLDAALIVLKREDFDAWLSMLLPYTGSEADPGYVEMWAENRNRYVTSRNFHDRHERAVRALTDYLMNVELHPVFPEMMSAEEERLMENENAAIYAAVQRLRTSRMSEKVAMEVVATKRGIPVSDVERIVEFRRGTKTQCMEEGCERRADRAGLCSAHYQRWRRRERKHSC